MWQPNASTCRFRIGQDDLKLEKLVVPDGLEKNPQLIAACREKGVTLV